MNVGFSSKGLLESDRFAEMLHQGVLDRPDADLELICSLWSFAEQYARFNNLSEDDVSRHYRSFAADYVRDLKAFEKDGMYPMQRGGGDRAVDRVRYDIALIFSTLFTGHRYRLMHLVARHFPQHSRRALSIGCGPALELMLIKQRAAVIEGYDLSLNPFCRHAHPDVHFFEKPFDGQEPKTYDALLAVELLEHVSDPHSLLQSASATIEAGGHLLLTTATDVPQFDHVYNFPADASRFEESCQRFGLVLKYKECVPHSSSFSTSVPCNTFYVFRKEGPPRGRGSHSSAGRGGVAPAPKRGMVRDDE